MSIYVRSNDTAVTVGYLENYYTTKNLYTSGLSTKINLAGTSALSGAIIPATNNSIDLGSSSYTYANVYANNITNVSTQNEVIVTGTDLGLNLDGTTDDTTLLQDGLDAYGDIGQAIHVVINSAFGMALHGIVTVPSAVHLAIECPIYIYGDGGLRTFGSYYETSGLIDMAGADVSTSDNVMDVESGHGLTVGVSVKIRGRNDEANSGAIEYETNIVTGVATNTITFLNDFSHSYQAVFDDQPLFTDKTTLAILDSSSVTTADNTMNRGDTSFTVADGSLFQKGDVVTIKDYVVVKTTYSNNTSNNTHRDDINRITDVTGNVLTVDSALSHNYLPTTHPVYIVKLKPTTKTKFENFRIIHKKHPTNRNVHCNLFINSFDCSMLNCSVLNNSRNKTIIVNETVGNVLTIKEVTDEDITISYTIPTGDYIISELCTLLSTNLTAQSALQYNEAVYVVDYSEFTGKITITVSAGVTDPNIEINYVAGSVSVILGFKPSDYNGNVKTHTGERVDISGNFLLPSTERHFYFAEAVGGLEHDLTFSGDIYWSMGTLMETLAIGMTGVSANGYTYTVTMDNTTDTIIFENSSAGNFSIVTTSKSDTIYKYLGLHNSKGSKISTISGADNYNSETDMSTVPQRLTPTSKGHGFRIDTSLYCMIDGCYFGSSDHVSSGESYAFALYRCRANTVTNCTAVQARHGLLFQTAQGNKCSNFTDINARISALDFHGIGSNDNLINGALLIGGVATTPDASTHTAIKIGNTSHVAGDSYNTIRNVSVTGYSNTDSGFTNYVIYLLPISNFNVIENVQCDGSNVGIYCTDVTGKDHADFQINDNIVRNCNFQNIHQPFNLDMQGHSTSLTTCNRMLIDSCVFLNSGSGGADESRARIQDGVFYPTVSNCIFKGMLSGSTDKEFLYIKDTGDCHILNNMFDDVFRGVYLDNVNTDPIVNNNTFMNLSGSSHTVIKDDGNSTGGQFLFNHYTGSTSPKTTLTGTNLELRHLYNKRKKYVSNAATDTTITSTITINNSAPTSGGLTVMGTKTVTYSGYNCHGTCYVKGFVPFQYPSTITANSMVVCLLFYDLSATAQLIGHSISHYTTGQEDDYGTITVNGEVDFTTKLSSGSSSFLLHIGTTSGDALKICSTFAVKPHFYVVEADDQT